MNAQRPETTGSPIFSKVLLQYHARCTELAVPFCDAGVRHDAHPSSTASAPFTASALSVTVFSSEPACTVMFSAKNRATVT
jgi:hypothetical protein